MILKQKSKIVLTLAFLGACHGQPQSTSQTKGHFDAGDSAAGQFAFADAQTIIPEIESVNVRSVVVGLALLTDFGRRDMLEALLQLDISELLIVVPHDFDGEARFMRDQLGGGLWNVRNGAQNYEVFVPGLKSIVIVRNPQMPGPGLGVATVWARDWSPLTAEGPNDEVRFLDFNYHSDRIIDGAVPRALTAHVAASQPVSRVPVPLYFEGGNFAMDGGENCYVSAQVSEANNRIEMAGDRRYNNAAIVDQFNRFGGCHTTEILPRMPYEGTGHLDMWMKFTQERTVLINELDPHDRNRPIYSNLVLRQAYDRVVTFLDQQAAYFTQQGYTVVRIPMPLPVFNYNNATHQLEGGFRSYTNSLLVEDKVLVPSYEAPAADSEVFDSPALHNGTYPEAIDELQDLQDRVEEAYEAAGISETRFIRSDDLIEQGGAVHCVTMQVPHTDL